MRSKTSYCLCQWEEENWGDLRRQCLVLRWWAGRKRCQNGAWFGWWLGGHHQTHPTVVFSCEPRRIPSNKCSLFLHDAKDNKFVLRYLRIGCLRSNTPLVYTSRWFLHVYVYIYMYIINTTTIYQSIKIGLKFLNISLRYGTILTLRAYQESK